jgi:hypothetical protein
MTNTFIIRAASSIKAASTWTFMPTAEEEDDSLDDLPDLPQGYPTWVNAADGNNGVVAFCGQAIITLSPDEKLMVQVGKSGLDAAEKSNTFTKLPQLLTICKRLGLPAVTPAQFNKYCKDAL